MYVSIIYTESLAAMQVHQSDPGILNRRTLEKDHRALNARLTPGMRVLDVGCGTGAITAGVARAVGPAGLVVGIDRDESLLEIARREHAAAVNLSFEQGNAADLGYENAFDIVTSARTLQWIAEPEAAVASMVRAAKPGGTVIVLEYDHTRHIWDPERPPEFRRFYDAFLAWRTANGWDNEMAQHLPALFRAAQLEDVEVIAQDESDEARIWADVIGNISGQLSEAGYCTRDELSAARESYELWLGHGGRHTLRLSAVVGRKPQLR